MIACVRIWSLKNTLDAWQFWLGDSDVVLILEVLHDAHHAIRLPVPTVEKEFHPRSGFMGKTFHRPSAIGFPVTFSSARTLSGQQDPPYWRESGE